MSQSFDIDTSYDALDDTIHDIFDVDAYCASLSPSIPSTESVPNTPAPTPRLKRYPKMRGHPRPSPTVVSPPVVTAATAVASTSFLPITTGSTKPDKGRGRQRTTATPSPACLMDASPTPVPTPSVDLTPEQHVCIVRMLKRLDEWLAQGWQPGVD